VVVEGQVDPRIYAAVQARQQHYDHHRRFCTTAKHMLLISHQSPKTVITIAIRLRQDYTIRRIRRYHDAFDYDGVIEITIRLRYDYDPTMTYCASATEILIQRCWCPLHIFVIMSSHRICLSAYNTWLSDFI